MANIFGNSTKNKLSSGKTVSSSGKGGGGKLSSIAIIGVIVAAVALAVAVGVFFSNISQKETYYVLATDVPAHTKITEEDMKAIKTSANTAPDSIGLSEIQQGATYAQYDLLAGDVLTASNTGSRASLYNGVSDQWVVTSFTIDSSDAVDGNIQRGDYFDMLGLGAKAKNDNDGQSENSVKTSQGATYIFYNMLCLFTSNHKTSQTAKDGTTTTTGESLEYFVALPPDDAAMLQTAMSSLDIKLVLSPRENGYKEPNGDAYAFSTFNYNGEETKPKNASLCDDSDENSADCTDNTFRDVQRNKFGVPYDPTDKEIDENGKIIYSDKKKLTKAEGTWCEALFGDSYYIGTRWDADKQYCLGQGFDKKEAKKLQEQAAKESGKVSEDEDTDSDDSSATSSDSESGDASSSEDTPVTTE